MTVEQINKELAEAMDGFEYRPIYDQEYAGEREYTGSIFVSNDMRIFEFSYKDPAIFAENVIWLLDHGWDLTTDAVNGYAIMYDEKGDGEYDNCVIDKDPYKAIALAIIEASKDNE